MARHRFRGFGFGTGNPAIAGPLIGGGATQLGIMLAHLHAKKNPAALRHAGVHGAIVGGLVGGVLFASSKYRELGKSALVTVAIMTLPRLLEGFMGLGHREETAAMHGLGIIVPSQFESLSGAEEPVVQLLDAGTGVSGSFGTHVAEEMGPGPEPGADMPVEIMGNGFGSNFLSAQ